MGNSSSSDSRGLTFAANLDRLLQEVVVSMAAMCEMTDCSRSYVQVDSEVKAPVAPRRFSDPDVPALCELSDET